MMLKLNLLLKHQVSVIIPYWFLVLFSTSLSAHVIVYGDVKDQGPILVTLNATEVPEDNWSAGTPKSTNLTEDQPATDLRSCQNDEFQCYGDFRCIPLTWRCDREADCKDASDERYCDFGTLKSCQNDQFECHANSECIPLVWRCNGRKDCKDDSDERNCKTDPSTSCDFRCKETNLCISQRLLCDGVWDCIPFGSDEDNCSPVNRCQRGQFMCHSDGLCFPESWRCDGVKYCKDGSDEINCNQSFH